MFLISVWCFDRMHDRISNKILDPQLVISSVRYGVGRHTLSASKNNIFLPFRKTSGHFYLCKWEFSLTRPHVNNKMLDPDWVHEVYATAWIE